MGYFVDLSTAIVTVLQGVTVNGDTFKDIQEFPTIIFNGYPAVTVAPSDNESDYSSTVENERTYVWYIDCYYPIEDPTSANGYASAFATMRVLMDAVLDALDNSNSLNGAAQIIKPAPSVWSVQETEASVMVNGRITLRTKVTSYTNNG